MMAIRDPMDLKANIGEVPNLSNKVLAALQSANEIIILAGRIENSLIGSLPTPEAPENETSNMDMCLDVLGERLYKAFRILDKVASRL